MRRAGAVLPGQATRLIGRERELEAAAELLRGEGVRLLCLVGPPGVGKTRLAVEVGKRLEEAFEDGVVFVDLAPLTQVAQIAGAVAEAIGVRGSAGKLSSLQHHLHNRQALIILDNFEHLVAGADLLSKLLAQCPDLKMLVTSRERLRLRWEHILTVPPLPVPGVLEPFDLQTMAANPAVMLFTERARAAKPDFELSTENGHAVLHICQRLEGLPLAIELAAAMSHVLSPEAMVLPLRQRLRFLDSGPRDSSPRHRSLRSAIEWSFTLLKPDEQEVFQVLGVFGGGVSLRMAEAVVSEIHHSNEIDLLAMLTKLVDRSLLSQIENSPEARFAMLETLRDFAAERLRQSGREQDVRTAHASAFAALAESQGNRSPGPHQRQRLASLEVERVNLGVAIEWLGQTKPEKALEMGVNLWWFWFVHGHFSEGQQALARLLEANPERTALRAQALAGIAWIATIRGDYLASLSWSAEAVEIAEAAHSPQVLAWCLLTSGIVDVRAGHGDSARPKLERAARLSAELDEQSGVAWATLYQAQAPLPQDPQRAGRDLPIALVQMRQIDDQEGIVTALLADGICALELADIPRAIVRFREGVEQAWALGHRQMLAGLLVGMGLAASLQGQYQRGLRLVGAGLGLAEALGGQPPQHLRPIVETLTTSALRSLEKATGGRLLAEGRTMRLEVAVEYALQGETRALGKSSSPPTSRSAKGPLTKREEQITALIAAGFTNRRIARELFITEGTAASHVQHILNKLGLESRTQIAVWAITQSHL